MIEYQKINNIKEECITNIQILYDFIRATNPTLDVKIKAVIVGAIDNNITCCVKGHLVLDIGNEKVIDPSYEVSKFKNSYYFVNIKNYIKFLKNNYTAKEQIEIFDACGGLNTIIQDHITFMNFANEMNNNNFVTNPEYYNNLCNYIQEKHKHQLILFTDREMKMFLKK
jgi:YHS domain-containing protein